MDAEGGQTPPGQSQFTFSNPSQSNLSRFGRKRTFPDSEETAIVESNIRRNWCGNPLYPSQQFRNPNETERVALNSLKGIPGNVILQWLRLINAPGFRNDPDVHVDQPVLDQNILQQPAAPWSDLRPGPSTNTYYPGPTLSSPLALGDSISGIEADKSPSPWLFSRLPTTNPIRGVSTVLLDDPSHIQTNDCESQDLPQAPTLSQPERIADRPQWACTWCKVDKFRGKAEWKKHQENFHFPKYAWYCVPDGVRVKNGGVVCCAICGADNPNDAHIHKHEFWCAMLSIILQEASKRSLIS